MSFTKLTSTLCGTFTGTSKIVVSLAFSEPGSGIVPDAITLIQTFKWTNHVKIK
jgi:hypothetical protein